jgi:RsiW-degrading membrane proteinase PrsW (M82 family)
MFAALMSIGITSFSGDFFAVFGLSLLSVFLIAPIAEEFFKGSGLAVLSGHHEFDSVEDGMAFGFAIGMGFSFVEDWLYLMNNPLGADALSWFIVFILRSIFFSINHGFYTAITGGVIGYLKEKAFAAPALGLLIGFPVAALFHAIHNSSEALIALFGDAGAVLYLCFLIPVFDYGGFIVLMVMFIRAITRERPK